MQHARCTEQIRIPRFRDGALLSGEEEKDEAAQADGESKQPEADESYRQVGPVCCLSAG